MGNSVLQLQHIRKEYPGVVALKDVTLELKAGEILALIGENGAGKSTLIKCCSGAVIPTSGKIIVNGREFSSMTPQLASENGIAIIYQEFNNVKELSAAENLFLGRPIRKGIVVDKKAMEAEAAKAFEQLHIKIDPKAMMKDLTVGYQQMVEIAKAIQQNARILIMDEPSAPLTSAEVESMFEVVELLRKKGVSIIYISHRLEEIFRLADRVSVLRDGQYIATKAIQDTDKDDLVRLMVGRTLKETYPERNFTQKETVLEVNHLTGNGVKNISFTLKKGEILGFGGLVGAGRTELAALLFGSAKIKSGEIILRGKKFDPNSPNAAIRNGICLVPEDRKQQGLILEMTVQENLTMAVRKKLSKRGIMRESDSREFSEKYVKDLTIRTPGIFQRVKNLSGGNQQKVVLGKWLGVDPEILIFDEPTRGIDVGAKQEIYKIMTEIVRQGKSIIMISSDMEELLGMSDRMVMLSKGRQTGMLEKEEFTQERVLNYISEVVEDE